MQCAVRGVCVIYIKYELCVYLRTRRARASTSSSTSVLCAWPCDIEVVARANLPVGIGGHWLRLVYHRVLPRCELRYGAKQAAALDRRAHNTSIDDQRP